MYWQYLKILLDHSDPKYLDYQPLITLYFSVQLFQLFPWLFFKMPIFFILPHSSKLSENYRKVVYSYSITKSVLTPSSLTQTSQVLLVCLLHLSVDAKKYFIRFCFLRNTLRGINTCSLHVHVGGQPHAIQQLLVSCLQGVLSAQYHMTQASHPWEFCQ